MREQEKRKISVRQKGDRERKEKDKKGKEETEENKYI